MGEMVKKMKTEKEVWYDSRKDSYGNPIKNEELKYI